MFGTLDVLIKQTNLQIFCRLLKISATFVPGYNLGGEGFDIVTMERKGAYVIDTETWNLGNGSSINQSNFICINQKVPVAVADWRNLPKCNMQISSTLYDSVETMVKDSTSSVSNWTIGLDIPVKLSVTVGVSFGGSHSRTALFGMTKSKHDRYSFVRHSVDSVNCLPPYCPANGSMYHYLIDIYGTHYITQVSLGGEMKATTAFKTCWATINGLSATEVSDCLSVEASVNVTHIASIKAMYKHCQEKKNKLLYSETRNGLKKEVEQYIMKNSVLKKCSETCQIGHRFDKVDLCACVCNRNQNLNSNCCPAVKGLATLKVFKLYAKKLHGDLFSETDAFVMVSYGNQIKQTKMIKNNNNPVWQETLEFGPIIIDMKSKLKFTVFDDDKNFNVEVLGECLFDLLRGKVSDCCMFKHGTFFFTYDVQCAPSLGGSQCQEYNPSPMNLSLAKVFYSRNRVLVGDSGQQFAKATSQSGFDQL
uniref:C2 domain-containing protein n=1 Tax=Kryptolebias marmoratus TaxID=37003 RepID=A0A3Q3F3T0_KRYMA